MMSAEGALVRSLYMLSDLLSHKAVVTKIGCGELNKRKYQWIQLNETIFHPKGGGQPADEGFISGIKITHVHKEVFDKNRVDRFEIYHCFDDAQEIHFKEGDEVELMVDGEKRLLHSRFHTGGHALADVVQNVFKSLEGYQGNHAPGDAYVKFKMLFDGPYDKEDIRTTIQPLLQQMIDQDVPVEIIQDEKSGMRAIQIGAGKAVPCGGTHLTSTGLIGQVVIPSVSVNNKEKTVTVKYNLT